MDSRLLERLDAVLERAFNKDPAAFIAATTKGGLVHTINRDRDLVERPRRGVWTIGYNRNRSVWQVYNDRGSWAFTTNTYEQARTWVRAHATLPRDPARTVPTKGK